MSGGSFDHAYWRAQEFADNLDDRLREAAELRDEGEEGPGVFDAPTTARLEHIAKVARHAAALMKEAEWLYSGDNSEESFAKNMKALPAVEFVEPASPTASNMVTIKRSAVDYSNHLALLAESLLSALDDVHSAEEAEDDAAMEAALELRSEYSAAVRRAAYQYRKRLPPELMDAATIAALRN